MFTWAFRFALDSAHPLKRSFLLLKILELVVDTWSLKGISLRRSSLNRTASRLFVVDLLRVKKQEFGEVEPIIAEKVIF